MKTLVKETTFPVVQGSQDLWFYGKFDSCRSVLGFWRWEVFQCSCSPGLSALGAHQRKMPGTRHPAVFEVLQVVLVLRQD